MNTILNIEFAIEYAWVARYLHGWNQDNELQWADYSDFEN